MTFRSDPGLVASAVALVLATWAIAALQAGRAEPPVCPSELRGCELPTVDLIKLGLSGVLIGQGFAVVLAVLLVADEYATGLMGTTLLAIPRRLAVVVAKAATALGAGGSRRDGRGRGQPECCRDPVAAQGFRAPVRPPTRLCCAPPAAPCSICA